MKLQLSKKQQVYLESIALGAILITAIALRTYKLGYWGLEGDELFTLRDSLTTSSITGPKPLLFFINYHLLASWTTLDELSLRVFPAVFGVASIVAVYWFARRTINSTTALVAAVLVTISPAHLYWSQHARYYTLAYLLTVLSALTCYLAICNNLIRWYVLSLLFVAMAWLAHPSTSLVVGAIVVWAIWQLKEQRDARANGHKLRDRILPILVLLFSALGAYLYCVPMLSKWYHGNIRWGYDWIHVTLGHLDAISPGIYFCGIAGILCLWTAGHRPLAGLMAAIAFIPLLSALVLCNWVAVTQGYLFVSTFVYQVGAAYFLYHLAANIQEWFFRRLTVAILLTLLLLNAAPRIWSHYCDGGRPDFRAASLYIRDHAGEHDKVLADNPSAVRHYLTDVQVSGFRRVPADLAKVWREMNDRNPRAKLWIVAAFRRRGGFNDLDLRIAKKWVNANSRIVASFSRSRLDYKHNEVRVYLLSKHSHEHIDPPESRSAD